MATTAPPRRRGAPLLAWMPIAMVCAASLVLGGCAGGSGGSAGSANGISMYGTIDQGVSFRSR
ncbi:hypothetical protein WM40_17515 [Robbsia andropogonis]|uniref:Uncharacterized protein n=1 Tax=Robbsia andropogonis TaxID=28092 RepID=A0A0F5JXQ6_9BURK|nr:hypothetical protein [Robbsia andropogonis]KKB62429.1 hypothetical protein WM40_17515 [Robbsia andropogonis]MCP1129919.1 hypothetical protein [Robbsia andropogonis]